MAVYFNEVTNACKLRPYYGNLNGTCTDINAIVLYDSQANTGTSARCEAYKWFIPYMKSNSACVRANNNFACTVSCVNYHPNEWSYHNGRLMFPATTGQRFDNNACGTYVGSFSDSSGFCKGFAVPTAQVKLNACGRKCLCLLGCASWKYVNDPLMETAIAIGGVFTPVVGVSYIPANMFNNTGLVSNYICDYNIANCTQCMLPEERYTCLPTALTCCAVSMLTPVVGSCCLAPYDPFACFAKNTCYCHVISACVNSQACLSDLAVDDYVTLLPRINSTNGSSTNYIFYGGNTECDIQCNMRLYAPPSVIFICPTNGVVCNAFKFRIMTPLDVDFCSCNRANGWNQYMPQINHTAHGTSFCAMWNRTYGFCNPAGNGTASAIASRAGQPSFYTYGSACVRFNYNFNRGDWFGYNSVDTQCARIISNYCNGMDNATWVQMVCFTSSSDSDGEWRMSWINNTSCSNAFNTGCPNCVCTDFIRSNITAGCGIICAPGTGWASGQMCSVDPMIANSTGCFDGGTVKSSYGYCRNNSGTVCRYFLMYESPVLSIQFYPTVGAKQVCQAIANALVVAMNKGMMWWHNKGYMQPRIATCSGGTLLVYGCNVCTSMYCAYSPTYLGFTNVCKGYQHVYRDSTCLYFPMIC